MPDAAVSAAALARRASARIAAASRPRPPDRCISARWSPRWRAMRRARARRRMAACASRTSTSRAAGPARSATSSRRSSATASRGTAPVVRQSERTARYDARARAAARARCRLRVRLHAPRARSARRRRGRRARLPGHVPRRHAATACARGAQRVARARRRRDRSHSTTGCRARSAGPRARRRRLRRQARRRPVRLSARGRRRRCDCRASPTSCAAPTCSRPRRARSSCSALLGVPTPAYLHVPVALNAAGEKLSKQTRAQRAAATIPLPALLAAWRFPRPAAARSRRLRRSPSSGAMRRAAWTPPRLPPVPMLPAPRVARRAHARPRIISPAVLRVSRVPFAGSHRA